MGMRRAVLANSMILLATTVVLRGLMFVLSVLVINRLGTGEVARFGTTFAAGMFLSGSVDFGMRMLLLREMPTLRLRPALLPAVLRRADQVRWLNFALLAVPVVAVQLALRTPALQMLELALFGLFGLGEAAAFQSKFAMRGLHRAKHEMWLAPLGRSVILGSGMALVATGNVSVAALGACFMAGSWFEAWLAARTLRAELRALPPAAEGVAAPTGGLASAASLGAIYRMMAPLGSATILISAMQRLPFFAMPWLAPARSLDLLTAGFKLPETGSFLPSNTMSAVIPALGTIHLRQDAAAMRNRTALVLEVMLMGGILFGGLISLEAASITTVLFKPELQPSMEVLALLGVWLGLLFVERAVGGTLIGIGGERATLHATACGFLTACLMAVVLIRPLGALGGAATILAGLMAHVAAMLLSLGRAGLMPRPTVLLRPALASVAMLAVWWLAQASLAGDGWFVVRGGLAGGAGLAAFLLLHGGIPGRGARRA